MLGQNLTRGIVIQMDARLAGYTASTDNIGPKHEYMMQQVKGRMHLHRDEEFLYIPYGENQITYVETELDCISSRFTGCEMAAFMWKGKRCVAHVATPECNVKWNTLKTEITLLSKFYPSKFFDGVRQNFKERSVAETTPPKFSTKPASQSDCFGIIDRNDEMYGGFLVSRSLGNPYSSSLSQLVISSCVPIS